MKTLNSCFFVILLSIFPITSFADAFHDKCPDIAACANAVSELLGQKYVFDKDVKGSVQATQNIEFSRENAELLFTHMLYTNGYSRVPLNQTGLYQIQKIRDAKDSNLPVLTADARTTPSLPNTWDLYTLKYKATHPEALGEISRMIRNFMPPNTRVVSSDLSGMLLMTAASMELKKLYDMVRENDQGMPGVKKAKEPKSGKEE